MKKSATRDSEVANQPGMVQKAKSLKPSKSNG